MTTIIGSRAKISTVIQVELQASSTGDTIDTAITLTKAGGKEEERGGKRRGRKEGGRGRERGERREREEGGREGGKVEKRE